MLLKKLDNLLSSRSGDPIFQKTDWSIGGDFIAVEITCFRSG